MAHLRIENRYIPSGPSIADEMANMAWWLGLMHGMPEEYSDMPKLMDFRDVKDNFLKAARIGRAAQMNWMGDLIPVQHLASNILIPIAIDGLQKVGIPQEEIDFYMDIIRARANGKTGAAWQIQNHRKLKETLRADESLAAITMMTYINQAQGKPVKDWTAIEQGIAKGLSKKYKRVDQLMSTDLITVMEDDLANLAAEIMLWYNIHHMPVENNNGELVGLLSWNDVKDYAQTQNGDLGVKDLMIKKPTTIYPEADVSNADLLMQIKEIGCLPVVQHGKLVGILTKNDVINYQNQLND